jgi:hypothetical protein
VAGKERGERSRHLEIVNWKFRRLTQPPYKINFEILG